jgi:N-acetylmuramate 1-kinase
MAIETTAGFILAAGEGRRLRPATLLRPKALMPFCGVPALELVASQLTRLGIGTVIVNAWYLAPQTEAAVADLRERHGWNLLVSREPELLDTGGGLRFGARLAPDATQFFVHNADVILDFPLQRLFEMHEARGAAVTALLTPGIGPCTVDMADDGTIVDFRRSRGKGAYTFSGVYIVRRDVLDLLPRDGPVSTIDGCEAARENGWPVMGLSTESAYWSDLGHPADYIRAHADVADRGLRDHPMLREAQAEQARRRALLERVQGVRCTGALGVGQHLVIPPGTHLHNVVLWDETRIARPFLYSDSVLSGDAVFPPPVSDHRLPDRRLFHALDVDPESCRIQNLRKQGSGRRYARIHGPAGQSWVWCAYNPERRENAAFVAIAEFLGRIGVRIPRVVVHLGDTCEIVLEDLGRLSLQEVTDPATTEAALTDVVAQIARLHVFGDRAARLEELPLQVGFTKGLYDWERDYFREHILGNLLRADELWADAAEEYCELRSRLLAEPTVPIHRDLQSANVMLVDKRAYLIDFQGMRTGCAAYDLGSLLFDPYKSHPAPLRARLWAHYKEEVTKLGGIAPADELLGAAAVQRLLQALGAYGKLWRGDGLPWYRQFILPALDLLIDAAASARFVRIAAVAHEVRARASRALDALPD